MLDAPTKRRIDDCRDILVGKLPDPKSQIEQITIALIYKFMDDMDKESIELGGKAKFFSDYKIKDPANPEEEITVEFEKYSWDNLTSPQVSANDLLRLYSEAIENMEKNPNIPQLFRDIFKNAYLPYRDPETLRMFLKEIGRFEYTHSEKLGDAFEYLLSIMGSQGDAGQFRTPRHIIDFLVKAVDPDKSDTILDPACGTAGFLISAFKHIKEKNNNLTPDERKKLIKNIIGYDISPDMVRMSLVNLYLHGFTSPHIYEYDSLSSEDRWDDRFDVILANPPFMSPKGGIRPHSQFTVKSNRSEVLFVDYIAEHLNPTGRAGIIVPEGVIFQSGKSYKELRKMLVENHLYAVVSLPAGVFNPYSGVKTSILLMDRQFAKTSNEILFVKVDNDGFNLGAQRNIIKGGQLEEAIDLLKQFKAGTLSEVEMAHAVLKSEIAENGDYNLSGERYKSRLELVTEYNRCRLDDVLYYEQPTKYIVESTEYNDSFKTPVLTAGKSFVLGYTNESEGIFESPLPVIIFDDFTTATKFVDFPFKVKSSAMKILRANKEKANITFLYYMIQHINFDSSNHKRYWISQYSKLQIPLPPLSVQEEIVAEIESYQKIIDGAKMVVENYKPKIDIDPTWEMVELGDISNNFQYGSSKKSAINGEIVCLRMGNIQNGEIDWTDLKFAPDDEDFKKYLLEPGDVLFNRTNSPAHVGKTGIYRGVRSAVFAGYLIRINYQKEKILGEYLNYCLNTKESKIFCQRVKTDGINQSNINAKILSTFKIPLPSIEIQKQIVNQIKKEQEIVNANKQLIEIFEQKIKDRIAKVWGEEKPEEKPELSMAAESVGEYEKS